MFPDPSQNPALLVLKARERLQQEAEAEFAKTSRSDGAEKRFIDVMSIRQILDMRDEKGMNNADIEQKMGLAAGIVRALGPKGVVGDVRVGRVTAEDSGIYD